jgi:hypothetical protein
MSARITPATRVRPYTEFFFYKGLNLRAFKLETGIYSRISFTDYGLLSIRVAILYSYIGNARI